MGCRRAVNRLFVEKEIVEKENRRDGGFLLMALGEIQLRGGGYLEHLILQFKQFWLDIHQLGITA